MSNSEQDERDSSFAAMRDHIWSMRQSNYEQSDSIIISLSSAFLGLSLGFIKEIVPLARVTNFEKLQASWILFGCSILTVLISYFVGRRAYECQIEFARQYYKEHREEYLDKPNYWTWATEFFNVVAALSFFSAVILTIAFTGANLRQEQRYQAAQARITARQTKGKSYGKKSQFQPGEAGSKSNKARRIEDNSVKIAGQ